jgi:hypothetical protein
MFNEMKVHGRKASVDRGEKRVTLSGFLKRKGRGNANGEVKLGLLDAEAKLLSPWRLL